MGRRTAQPSIRIDEEFRRLIPSLRDAERRELECSLISEGCRDPVAVWDSTGILLDGHHRYDICRAHDIEFGVHKIRLASRNAAKMWIIRNQFARRNLAPYQKAELVLKLKPLLAAEAKKRRAEAARQGGRTAGRGRRKGQGDSHAPTLAHGYDAGETRDRLAEESGVSHGTMAKVEYLDAHADEQTKVKLRGGETTINREYTRLREREQQARNEVLRARNPLPPPGKYDVVVIDPHDLRVMSGICSEIVGSCPGRSSRLSSCRAGRCRNRHVVHARYVERRFRYISLQSDTVDPP